MTAPLSLIVASLKQTAARCRVLEDPPKLERRRVTLRATRLWRVVPGEILTVQAHKRWTFDPRPEDAIKHYEVGIRIGELSLGAAFDGVLPWSAIDNRPFLRCMAGYGLCLWRLGKTTEAAAVFERMLWLNPSDNQGERLVVGAFEK